MEAVRVEDADVRKSAKVTVVEESCVYSGVATGSIALNGLDLFNASTYVSQVLIYRDRLDAELLKRSLRRVLSHFPVFAGRVVKRPNGAVEAVVNDCGVPFTVQASSLTLADYCSHGCASFTADASLTDQFRQYNSTHTDMPSLAIRITYLADGASVLGMRFFHGIADQSGIFVLLAAWSATIRRQLFKNPQFDRGSINRLGASKDGLNPSGQEPLVDVDLMKIAARIAHLRAHAKSSRRAVLRIDAAKIDAIRRHALASGRPTRWVSTQDLVVAYVWRSIAAACPQENSTTLSYVVDLRSCYGMGISHQYVGNATTTRLVSADREALVTGTLLSVAEQVRAACDRVDADSVGTDLAFLSREFASSRRLFVLKSMLEPGLMIPVNNFSTVPVYGIDLGVGEPIWYGPPENDNLPRLVHIVPAPGGEAGVDVHLKLPGEELERSRAQLDAPETQVDASKRSAEVEKWSR